jgi:hypothetical protein
MTGAILWYATLGAGAVSFILLSSVVTFSILSARRWRTAAWPRFLNVGLHRRGACRHPDGAADLMRNAQQPFVDEFSVHQRGGCRHGAPLGKAA